MSTNLANLPLHLKPREKMLQLGAEHLELTELLAIILGTGTLKQDVLQISQKLASVLRSGQHNIQAFQTIQGIGLAKATEVMAALTLSQNLSRYLEPTTLSRPEAIFEASLDLIDLPNEHLVVFFISTRGKQILRETVSIGTLNASLIHPREVFRPAILHNAAQIAIAHNHPSGNQQPSQADLETTNILHQAGKMIGIDLIDHLIISKEGYYSIAQKHPHLFQT
jgi:DNA repair protein RadC